VAFQQVGKSYITLCSGVYLASARTAQAAVGLDADYRHASKRDRKLLRNRPALVFGSDDFIYQAYPFVPRFEAY
jgi:hypothetical protein